MLPINSNGTQQVGGPGTKLSKEDVIAVREHLTEILEGPFFIGTHRRAQFLRYVVEQALAGHPDALKEREIGTALFGRSQSYETKEDAIVRVTASEVRKRLEQHYQKYGLISKFRIGIPPGSYNPVFSRVHRPMRDKLGRIWSAAVLIIAVVTISTIWFVHARAATGSALPWSVFFQSDRPLKVIASDPNLAEIAWLTGKQVSLSDYANHIYVAESNWLTPDGDRIARMVLRGDKASLVDSSIVANVGALAGAKSRVIEVHGARDIQLSDLKTENNFVFLGSPRSNPWTALFGGQLDFRFDFNDDPKVLGEFIRNVRPKAGEKEAYMPTAPGWATGDSFAILAFIPNPDQKGQVLLLQGISAEATKAAGQLATDLPRFSSALQKCGLSSSDGLHHFELLLRVNTMAGQPMQTDIVACHVLDGTPAQKS
jgi:hypothetical protein